MAATIEFRVAWRRDGGRWRHRHFRSVEAALEFVGYALAVDAPNVSPIVEGPVVASRMVTPWVPVEPESGSAV